MQQSPGAGRDRPPTRGERREEAQTSRDETRREQSRAGGGGGTQGRSRARADRAPVAHVRDVDDGSGIISDSAPVREFGPSLIWSTLDFLFFKYNK